MSKQRKFVLVALCLLSISLTVQGGTANAQNSTLRQPLPKPEDASNLEGIQAHVRLTAILPKRIVAGHPIVITVVTSNLGKTSVTYGSTRVDLDYTVTLQNARHQFVPYINPETKNSDGGRYMVNNILPGKTLTEAFDITVLFPVLKPGIYTLVVKRGLEDTTEYIYNLRNWDHPELMHNTNFVIQSDPVKFVIAPG